MNKLLSICVPCYNVEQYLDKCLSSILTTELREYLDVLVVNDGSLDGTITIIKRFAEQCRESVSIIDQANGGHGSAINVSLERAVGQYFMVVDSDDWVDTSSLTTLLQRLRDHQYDADLISMNYMLVDDQTHMETPWEQAPKAVYEKSLSFAQIDTDTEYFTLAGTVFRTDVLRNAGRKLLEHTYYDDVEYILFPIPYVNTVLFSELNLYRYRRGREGQSVNVQNMIKKVDHHERVLRSVLRYRKECEMDSYHAAYYDSVLCKVLITHYSLCLMMMDIEEGSASIRMFDRFLCAEFPRLAQRVKNQMRAVSIGRFFSYNSSNIAYVLLLGLIRKRNQTRQRRIKARARN